MLVYVLSLVLITVPKFFITLAAVGGPQISVKIEEQNRDSTRERIVTQEHTEHSRYRLINSSHFSNFLSSFLWEGGSRSMAITFSQIEKVNLKNRIIF